MKCLTDFKWSSKEDIDYGDDDDDEELLKFRAARLIDFSSIALVNLFLSFIPDTGSMQVDHKR